MSKVVRKVIKFEKSNLKTIVNGIKKNPERLLIGAIDPASSKVWGKVLGKNYEPLVDQMGGASKQAYKDAIAKGIDIGPGAAMHKIARTIASFYAGGAAGKAVGNFANVGDGIVGKAIGQGVKGVVGQAAEAGAGTTGLELPAVADNSARDKYNANIGFSMWGEAPQPPAPGIISGAMLAPQAPRAPTNPFLG